MDEEETRGLFYERLARGDEPDEAVASAYCAIGLRVIASIAPPQDDSPWYWKAVTAAMQMKTLMCRPEMDPGAAGRDQVPIAGRYADAFLEALRMQRELWECFHDHLHLLPPTPMKARYDRDSIGRELVRLADEQARYAGAAINGGSAVVPRWRFVELDRFPDAALEALLGAMTYRRFAERFNTEIATLRSEHACQQGGPKGPSN